MQEFGFSDQLSQQEKTVRFVKLKVETYFGDGGGLRYLSFSGPLSRKSMIAFKLYKYYISLYIEECKCNGKTVRINEELLDGECNSLRRFEEKLGYWKYFCYINPEEDCGDNDEGRSFKACQLGIFSFFIQSTFIYLYLRLSKPSCSS